MTDGFNRGASSGRFGRRRFLTIAGVSVAVVVAAGVGLAVLLGGGAPEGLCGKDDPACGNPPVGPGLVINKVFRSSELGYQFEYSDDKDFGYRIVDQNPRGVKMVGPTLLEVVGAPASEATPQQLLDQEVKKWRKQPILDTRKVLGVADDTESADDVLDPQLADRNGSGRVMKGTLDLASAPSTPVGLVFMASGDSDVSMAVGVLYIASESSDSRKRTEQRRGVLGVADSVLNTLRLPADLKQ